MRRAFHFIIAAVLGAGCYLAYHRWTTGGRDESASARSSLDEARPAAEAASRRRDAPELGAPGPILSDAAQASSEALQSDAAKLPDGPPPAPAIGEDEAPVGLNPSDPGKSETARPSAPAPAQPVPEPEGGVAPGGAPQSTPSESSPAPVAPASKKPAGPDVDTTAQLAQAAFDAGDTARGLKLTREVFRSSPEAASVNLVPLARRLLEVEERGANDRPAAAEEVSPERLELYRYLLEKDGDPRWRYRAGLGLGTLESKSVAPDTIRAAWDHLTRAYLAAAGKADRAAVVSVLEPFLKRNVFSKRYSPLVATHTVKPGESLYSIAKARGTTEEAIQRLNQLNGAVIHPGQRLIALEGKPRVFVKKSEFRLWFLIGDRLLLEAPVGLGRDNSTPASTFSIHIRQRDPIWYRRGEPPIPAGDPKNILGSRWLGFKETADLSGFGIHGATDPNSIGKEESSGCIRLHNRDLELLWDFVPIGTAVEVSE